MQPALATLLKHAHISLPMVSFAAPGEPGGPAASATSRCGSTLNLRLMEGGVAGVDEALVAVTSNPSALSAAAQAAISAFVGDRSSELRDLAASGDVSFTDLDNLFVIIGNVMR